MSTVLKILIGLAVALPLAAFVAGSLTVSSQDSPPRERIIVEADSSPAGDDGTWDPGRDQDPARELPAGDDDYVGTEDDREDDADDDYVGTDDDTDDDSDDTNLGFGAPGGGGADDDERDDDSDAGGSGGANDDDDSTDDDTGGDDIGDDDD